MKPGTVIVLVALSLAAFMAGGCAKKEIVKSEEPTALSVTAKAPEPAAMTAPSPTKAEVPAAVVQPQVIAESAPPAVQVTPAEVKAPVAEAALENIYFDFDKSDLLQDARNVLEKNAEVLMKVRPSIKVQISGNCDERGSDEYNLALGDRRAKAAERYLVNLGVPAGRLSTISYGSEKPAVDGHDEASWSKNRRDEFVIVK